MVGALVRAFKTPVFNMGELSEGVVGESKAWDVGVNPAETRGTYHT